MRIFTPDETYEARVKENATKICLIDRMILQKFKYKDDKLLYIVYANYISNHQEIFGRPLHDAFSQYFDSELTMNISDRVINMIRMATFTPAIYDLLKEFYSLFLVRG